jgi:uncharacterized protein involved in exopolysaccharide biosynthesis
MTDNSVSGPPPAGRTDDEDLSLIALATAIFSRFSYVWRTALIVALLAIAYTAIKGVKYVAEAKFTLESGTEKTSRFSGLASQFGLTLPGNSGAETLQFYSELLKSREILRGVASTVYEIKTDDGVKRGDLATLYEIEDTPDRKLRAAMTRLGENMSSTTNLDANVIAVRVTTPYPNLSVQVTRRLLTLLDEQSREIKRRRASAEREFARARMNEVSGELRQAELELEEYLSGNRGYQGSARQNLEVARIQRKVDMHQQLYMSLAQAHEQARLDEVRSTPVIGLIDAPEGSIRRNGGNYVRSAILGLIFGVIIGIVLALWREYFERFRATQPERYAELREALAEIGPRKNKLQKR